MIEVQESAGKCVVTPTGNIVASCVDEFRRDLQLHIEAGQLDLVIQLDQVQIIDSRGLAVFMLCHNSLSARGGRLTVVTRNEDLRHLFRVMRMDQHFAVVEKL